MQKLDAKSGSELLGNRESNNAKKLNSAKANGNPLVEVRKEDALVGAAEALKRHQDSSTLGTIQAAVSESMSCST